VTIAQLLELGRRRWEALITTGAEGLLESTTLGAGRVPEGLWKNCRFQKKAIL
jgi:hypothetical protein